MSRYVTGARRWSKEGEHKEGRIAGEKVRTRIEHVPESTGLTYSVII